MAQAPTYDQVAGCYNLAIGEWNRPLGGEKGLHAIPVSIRLDTAPAMRGGRVAYPDIAFPMGRAMRGMPRWEMLGDTVLIVWSDGYSPTVLRLRRDGNQLRGWADAQSDAIPPGKPNWPRALVVARRITCRK